MGQSCGHYVLSGCVFGVSLALGVWYPLHMGAPLLGSAAGGGHGR